MKKFKGIIISIAAALVAATAVTMPSTAYDVNNDGIVSIADAVLMQRYLLNALDDTERQSLAESDFMSNADLNNDGSVDVFDFILMRDYLVNEGIVKRNITREEFLDLLLSKEEFTWSDFEQYRSVDVGSGMYILQYKIEFEDGEDNVFLYVCGESMDENPENIYLERCSDGETVDIYELRRALLYLIDGFKVPENNETNRNNVQKIADYAFSGLKDGTFDLQTSLDYDDIADNSELADCWEESHCLYFDFIDEHTVKVVLNGGGFFEVYGYLVTDGTVEYETGWFDNINVGYDGGGINIEERNGNLYFFNAGL